MKWTQFLLSLSGLYSFYYAGNILFDFLRSPKKLFEGKKQETHFFADDIQPELILPDQAGETDDPEPSSDIFRPPEILPAPTLTSTGEVEDIADLFALAKQNLIEYTRTISY